jgi:hypothetical protein
VNIASAVSGASAAFPTSVLRGGNLAEGSNRRPCGLGTGDQTAKRSRVAAVREELSALVECYDRMAERAPKQRKAGWIFDSDTSGVSRFCCFNRRHYQIGSFGGADTAHDLDLLALPKSLSCLKVRDLLTEEGENPRMSEHCYRRDGEHRLAPRRSSQSGSASSSIKAPIGRSARRLRPDPKLGRQSASIGWASSDSVCGSEPVRARGPDTRAERGHILEALAISDFSFGVDDQEYPLVS